LVNDSIDKNTKVLLNGGIDKKDDRYISPTVILNPSEDSQLMKEEIFGPVLPIISYQSIDEAINRYILKKGKPLSIYFFGNIFNNKNY
jgi:aldehyde dehydrogenase (NAD+)